MKNFLSRLEDPKGLSRAFRLLAFLQIGLCWFHFSMAYRVYGTYGKSGWSWAQEIKISPKFDYERHWNKVYKFGENVETYFHKGVLIFTYDSFQALLNWYSIGFFICLILKWAVAFYVFWQLSKVFSKKTDFLGFTTEGVKYLRKAAAPIFLIPILGVLAQWIFIKYAATQSSYISFSEHTIALISDDSYWLFYLYASTILFGLAGIFSHGAKLKTENELTV